MRAGASRPHRRGQRDMCGGASYDKRQLFHLISNLNAEKMALQFEVGASVTLVGKDLQFVGVDGQSRIRFLIAGEALKRVAAATKDLTRQEQFKVYDRNREWFQEAARGVYQRAKAGSKTLKITAADL